MNFKQRIRFTCSSLLSLVLFPLLSFAESSGTSGTSGTTDAGTMLNNLAATSGNLMSMVTGIAYVMGLFFIVMGLMKLKQYGEQRTMMSSQHELKGPVLYMIVGTALLYLPTSVTVGFSTFWTDGSPLAYIPHTDLTPFSQVYHDGYVIIALVGTIAFIRGLVTLTHIGGHGGQQNTATKALTYIISGICCINLHSFLVMISRTLGLQF